MSKHSMGSVGATTIGSVVLPTPVMNASGTAGHGLELHPYMPLSELGAFVVKSLASFPWSGNAAPRLHPTPGGMLNAVGLQGPGLEEWIATDLPQLVSVNARIVVSIWGFGVEDYVAAARVLAPVASQLTAVEINLSCPNTKSASDMSSRHEIFAHDPDLVEEIVRQTSDVGVPTWAKLSPNTHLLIESAQAAQRGGADAVTLINTALGMVIDLSTGLPALGNGGGGLSGRSIHPIAVRAVHEVATHVPGLAIIGAGGVTTGSEAIELMMAGASAVQIGTATFAEPRAALRIHHEMVWWAHERKVTHWSEVIGCAQRGGLVGT